MKLEEAEDELDEQRQKEKSLEFQLSLKEAVHEENERLQNEKSVLSELVKPQKIDHKNNAKLTAMHSRLRRIMIPLQLYKRKISRMKRLLVN